MAAGRPVIAYGKGGVTETIIDGKTGVFFHEQTWESLYQAVRDFDPMEWNGQELHKHAAQFSEMAFAAQIKEIVEQAHHKKTFV
jgi:glycosyltransferase involved in cell wall biosynthesis